MLTWIIAGSLVLGAPALKNEPKPRPVDPPNGKWAVVRMTIDGYELAGDSVTQTWEFAADSRRVFVPGSETSTHRATYFHHGGVLEADLDTDFGVRKAIWKVEGKTLTICMGREGKPRPTTFSAPKESGRILVVLSSVNEFK